MLSSIPSATLRQLVKLSEKKDALLARIQKIDREMTAIQRRAGSAGQMERAPVSVSRSRKRKSRRRKGR